MADFNDAFTRFLELAQQDMASTFVFRRDAMVAGRWVALYASFDVRGERKPFGMIPTGNFTHCFEHCVFLPAERLDETALDELLKYIAHAHDTLVQPDGVHEFSLVSLVLATHGALTREMLKKIKKYQLDKRYKKPQNGWSSVRLAVADLEHGTVAANRAGSALADRLKPTLQKM